MSARSGPIWLVGCLDAPAAYAREIHPVAARAKGPLAERGVIVVVVVAYWCGARYSGRRVRTLDAPAVPIFCLLRGKGF